MLPKIILLLSIVGVICSAQTHFQRKQQSRSDKQANLDDDFVPYNGERYDSFDWALSKKIVEQNPGSNIIISPISIKMLLALLSEGSGNKTSEQLTEILELPVERQALRERMQKFIKSIMINHSEYELQMDSKLFLDQHYTPRQRYAAILQGFYNTTIDSVDFVSNPTAAKDLINNWVKSTTKTRVDGFFTDEDVANARLILLNTIYFKGNWRNNFFPNKTHNGYFYVNSKEISPAEFMTNVAQYYYCESPDLDAKILRLPYKGGRFAMYMFLPNSKNGIGELVNRITAATFHKHLWQINLKRVEVVIPKITFEFTARLGPLLHELGITEIFEDTVSLAGIARGQNGGMPNLVVTNILQKSGIEINEEGSEAYSATAVTLGNKFDSDYIFNASHPFLFLIEDEQTGTILYFGKIENPSKTMGELWPNKPWPPITPPKRSTSLPNGVSTLPPPSVLSLDSNTEQFVSCSGHNPQSFHPSNYFDIEFLQSLCTKRQGNVLTSPIIVKIILSMILEGATGETAHELQSALRLPEKPDDRRNYIHDLINNFQLDQTFDVQLSIANALFYSKSISLQVSYVAIIRSYYMSELNSIDFTNQLTAAQLINNWVAYQTKGVITEIVNQNSLSPDTLTALVNAIYFKSNWLREFVTQHSKEQCFYVIENGVQRCEKTVLMHMAAKYCYAALPDLNAQAVEIPYKDTSFSMLLLVPNKQNGIDQLIRDLPHKSLSNISLSLQPTEIKLTMPKFKLEFNDDIQNDLKNIGIKKLFGNTPELSGIVAQNNNVKVDRLIHKVVIEVNEKGSIAAAASTATIVPLISPTNPVVYADHPFLFFIRTNGHILFAGRISNPLK